MINYKLNNVVRVYQEGTHKTCLIKGMDLNRNEMMVQSLSTTEEASFWIVANFVKPVHLKNIENWFSDPGQDDEFEFHRITYFKIKINEYPKIIAEIKPTKEGFRLNIIMANMKTAIDLSSFKKRVRNAFYILIKQHVVTKKEDFVCSFNINYYHEFQNICSEFSKDPTNFSVIKEFESILYKKNYEEKIYKEKLKDFKKQIKENYFSVVQNAKSIDELKTPPFFVFEQAYSS